MQSTHADYIVVGAGAAGLMCAAHLPLDASKMVIDHNATPGKKILISGGGKCNFTNTELNFENYLSENKHFFKSALKSYTHFDFLSLVEASGIEYHEKKPTELFCKKSAKQILSLLLDLSKKNKVEIHTSVKIIKVEFRDKQFNLTSENGKFFCDRLIIATGGLSFPKLGASDFGFQVAKQFGHKITATRPALVSLRTPGHGELAGLSLPGRIWSKKSLFSSSILFTHHGLSGPAILKMSLVWTPPEEIHIDWLPQYQKEDLLSTENLTFGQILKGKLPKNFIEHWFSYWKIPLNKKIEQISKQERKRIIELLKNWTFNPTGTEGFRRAEVTAGGVSTAEICSKTMESKNQSGLYFIGEVLDVTGQLGGHNFQWAWSSAMACARSM